MLVQAELASQVCVLVVHSSISIQRRKERMMEMLYLTIHQNILFTVIWHMVNAKSHNSRRVDCSAPLRDDQSEVDLYV